MLLCSLLTACGGKSGGGNPAWYVKDGRCEFGAVSDSFKTYLECMNSWYEKGWLDRNFSSRTQDMFYQIDDSSVRQGKVGYECRTRVLHDHDATQVHSRNEWIAYENSGFIGGLVRILSGLHPGTVRSLQRKVDTLKGNLYDPALDPRFQSPFIDAEEWREDISAGCTYVHGGFDGTDLRFSCFLSFLHRVFYSGGWIIAKQRG